MNFIKIHLKTFNFEFVLCRSKRGLLNTIQMAPIDSVQIYSNDEIEAAADRYSLGHRTKSKRESSKNELTVQYGTKYRNPENTRELLGKLQPLEKAFAILAVCMFAIVWTKFAL